MPPQPEPWLRGSIEGVHPLAMPVFFSFAQVREDLAFHTAGLSREQVWRNLAGVSLGFHLKHIAGSVDRLTTYITGCQLNETQLRALKSEHEPDADLDELLGLITDSLASSEAVLRGIDPEEIYDVRTVGRRNLPSTVLGLLVHLSEHTQRHLGQAIILAKLLRAG